MVGEGVVVTLFQEQVVTPPQPVWWPVFWYGWRVFWRLLYTPLVVTQPRTFFANGTYNDLGGYIADYSDRVVALRVDRLTEMTALRKAAIMKRLKDDLVAVQDLLDKTPGGFLYRSQACMDNSKCCACQAALSAWVAPAEALLSAHRMFAVCLTAGDTARR